MKKRLHVNLIKVIHMLDDGQYHDGNTLGEKLKISRAAIWKIIRKLKGYGIPIDSVKGKGHALLAPLILLELNKIKKELLHKKLDITLFTSMGSTNGYLKTVKNTEAVKICLAEQQTAGKGRLNREWYSPFGQNIYLSCLYPFKKDISGLAGLSLVTSLAVIKTLKHHGIKENLFVKWPNDVIYQNKKISGNLIEIQAESHGMSHAIMGIGINVNMVSDVDHRIVQPWTSMYKILGNYIDRNEVIANLINYLISYIQQFDARGFNLFMDEWMHADYLANRLITVKNVHEKIKGRVKGINDQGYLLLQLENGALRLFSSGDTAIVKEA